MTDRRIAVIASPCRWDLARAIAKRMPVVGLFTPVRTRREPAPVTPCADFAALLRDADICCFLSPYPAMERDMQLAAERGIHVLSAGPPSLARSAFERLRTTAARNRLGLAWGGQHRHSPLHQALLSQRRTCAFGTSVFLRLVREGGDSLLAAWWAAVQALEQAIELLGATAEELYVAAIGRKGRYHVTLTASTSRGTAQLAVAPFHPTRIPDITLLGTGGLLGSSEYANAIPLANQRGVSYRPSPGQLAEPAWILHFARQVACSPRPRPEWDSVDFSRSLLATVRLALRRREPISVRFSSPPPAPPF